VKTENAAPGACQVLLLGYNFRVEPFRHNLTPVEVKTFLRLTADLTENLLIRYCYQTATPCPTCRRPQLIRAAAISLYSRSLDKLTHELSVCLACGFKEVVTLQTCEGL
jgi:hypothetical protein